MDYDQQVRIARNVILGLPPEANETPEAAAWRQSIERDNEAAKQAGHMLDLPFDWQDNTPFNQRAAHPPGAFAKKPE
jgi:hypothetical protein